MNTENMKEFYLKLDALALAHDVRIIGIFDFYKEAIADACQTPSCGCSEPTCFSEGLRLAADRFLAAAKSEEKVTVRA